MSDQLQRLDAAFEARKQRYENSFFAFANTVLFLATGLACLGLALAQIAIWDDWHSFANLLLMGIFSLLLTSIGWIRLYLFSRDKARYETEREQLTTTENPN